MNLTIATQPRMSVNDVVDVQLTQQGTGLAVPAGVQVGITLS